MAKRHKKSKTVRYKKSTDSNILGQKNNSVSRVNNTQVSVNVNKTRSAVLDALRGKFWVPLGSALLLSSYSYALGLQEIQVNSNLGEPLSAMVYLSNPSNKRIYSDCFKVTNGGSELGMPALKDATLRVNTKGSQTALQISTNTAVKEPISELTIVSSCSTLPVMQRTYTLMLDPAVVGETRFANNSYRNNDRVRNIDRSAGTQGRTLEQSTRRSSTRLNARTSSNNYGAKIAQGSRYTVQSGDTLSTIAARIGDRPYGSVWSLAAAIHTSNPQAFTGNNPNLIELGAEVKIPVINSRLANNKLNASNLLDRNTSGTNGTNRSVSNTGNTLDTRSNTSSAQTLNTSNNTQQEPVIQYIEAPSVALPTMTATTRLSSLSLDRIKVRASGGVVQQFTFDNKNSTSSITGTSNTGGSIDVEKPVIANIPNTPGLPTGNTSSTSSSFFSRFSWLGLLGALALLGLATWKLIIPKLQRMARVNFFKRVRRHKKKKAYLERNNRRKAQINRTASHRMLEVSDDSVNIGNDFPQNNYIVEESNAYDLQTDDSVSFDTPISPDDLNISDSTVDVMPALTIENEIMESDIDVEENEVLEDFVSKTTGPRKARVASEVYEVGMIDDTGELVSLTTAFPELEAELNARLGDDMPDLGADLSIDEFVDEVNATRQTKTMELSKDEFAGLQLDPSLNNEQDPANAETRTVKMEAPLGDSLDLDLELPGLTDETVNIGADFDTIADENDMNKTMVFNEEIFAPVSDDFDLAIDDPFNATTLSTELLDADAETRVAPILSDEDGLSPSDFGLSDDDFPVDREDYAYLEPDASIITEGLSLTQEELEELGMGDDDNIIPFATKKDKKKSA